MNTDPYTLRASAATKPRQSPQEIRRALDVRKAHIERHLPTLKRSRLRTVPADTDRYATFVDFRRSHYTEFALRNVMCFLGEAWGLQIFVPAETVAWIGRIIAGWKEVRVYALPSRSLETGGDVVNRVLKQPEFWRSTKGEWQLLFNSDSMLCRSGIEAYMSYDYIGPPWPDDVISPWCRVGGGGLSLRRKRAMLDVCRTCNTNPWIIGPEDAFFSINMHLSPDIYRLPPPETARRFAVERLFHPDPLGVHRAWRYIDANQLEPILDRVDYPTT